MSRTLPPADADVRMRGFAQRVTVEDALAWIDETIAGLVASAAVETVATVDAATRVLADRVVSQVQVPPFARSMMDGFAVRAADTDGATIYNRLPLRVTGEALPGRPFAGTVSSGDVVRIMTGAPLPAGADAVLPVEKTDGDGSQLFALESVSPGKNVGRSGEDVEVGDELLRAGRILRPQDIGLLVSIGCATVQVVRRPTVRVLITGNELLPAGQSPVGSKIVDSNGPMLAALIQRDGGLPINPGIIPDDPAQILAALGEPADVVLVSGGSSVGQEDHAPRLLAQLGELAIHGIAMRPSSPAGMGRIDNKLVFLLPGNPVSCLCAYDFFAGRAIRRLGGLSVQWPYARVRLPLSRKLVSQVGRVDYARVRIVDRHAEPLAISGASLLTSVVTADGFVIVPADSEGYPPGAEVEVWLYE